MKFIFNKKNKNNNKNTNIIGLILFCLSFIFSNKSILASENIFGLHLTQPEDLSTAKDIINSNGGDWGWITIVIRLDQLDKKMWQDFFDNCRQHHLIPIIRLATIADEDNWKIPSLSDIDKLTSFLSSLNWPTKTQHVILFNEINHGQEWGGEVDIKNYVDSAIYASQKLKNYNQNFFVLGGSLDLASPESPPNFKSAQQVYQEIYDYNPQYFDYIDGIASHSYPNHGFLGTPRDKGQHSILGYSWELDFLNQLGIKKEFPVFITETGWPHQEGISKKNNYYTTKTTSQFLLDAYSIWSEDKKIKAVTPFIYNYPASPFDHFSWLDQSEKLFPEYQKLIDLKKTINKPEQITKYGMYGIHLPFLIFANHQYSGQISLKNIGQSIWGETEFCINPQVNSTIEISPLCITKNDNIKPGQIKIFNFQLKIIDSQSKQIKISWENLPETEISLLSESTPIYRPRFNLIDRIKSFLTKFW
jgi:hypothetical protein